MSFNNNNDEQPVVVQKKEKREKGRLSPEQMMKLLNKQAQSEVSFSLEKRTPSEVSDWIPSGCRLLDSIACRNQSKGTLPLGKFVEIAGQSGTGKSYIAAKMAAQAQKMGMDVVYYDSESALDGKFLEKAGCDVSKIIYCQAKNVEFVFESVNSLIESNDNRMLFIWDTPAFTPTSHTLEADEVNPQATMALKSRICGLGFEKIIQPIANSRSCFLVINQLRQRIGAKKWEEQFFTPGGNSFTYVYSLRYWLTGSVAKDSMVSDDSGNTVGTQVTVSVKKSRFGTFRKKTTFQIKWGDIVDFDEEMYWLDEISNSPYIKSGTWWTLTHSDGTEEKFQKNSFQEKLKNDKFRQRILELLDEEICNKNNTDETEDAPLPA